MTARVALGLGAVVFALTGGTAASAAALPPPLPPRLRPAAGWIVLQHGPSQPYLPASMVVAVTVRDRAAVRPFAPFVGFTRLSTRGIVVWAWTLGRGLRGFSPLEWPPVLSRFRVDRGWEGQPAPNIQQRLHAGRVHGWDLDLRVYFATQHPDEKLLAKAQTELRRLLPPSR